MEPPSELQNSNSSAQNDTEKPVYSAVLPIKTLRQLVINNIEHYQKSRSSTGEKFFTIFCVIEQESDALRPAIETLEAIAPRFDFDEKTPGNGYRSLIRVVDCCVEKLIQISRYVAVNRDSMLFRSSHYLKELEAYGKVLSQLRVLLGYGEKLLAYSDVESGQLFPDKEQLDQMPIDIMLEVQALDRECFYGRCLGFQFCDSMWQSLQTVAVALASYSEGYHKHEGTFSRAASSIFHGSRYLTNPEARAKQIVSVTNKSDIRFCKAFWSITEGDVIADMCNLMAGTVAINKLIQIQPHTFELDGEEGEPVTIVPPCAHTGPASVQIRLLSFVEREGQSWLHEVTPKKDGKVDEDTPPKSAAPMSKGLLIHIHGGGFVAHTSKSHEIYLRSWARDLGVPIVSIDYSLAPEQPFPRAFEECFFAYAWVIKNAQFLGSTGEHICLAGDSAGGNLSIAVGMRAASYGIRPPNGVVTMYTPFNIHYQPSPSRMLCLLDPLLPIGILIRCLAAYAGLKDEFISEEMANEIIEKANDKFHVIAARKTSRENSVNSTGSGTSEKERQIEAKGREAHKKEESILDIDNNIKERQTEDPDEFLRTLEMNDSAWSANIDDGDLKLPDDSLDETIAKMSSNGDVIRSKEIEEPETIAVVDPNLPPGSPSMKTKVIRNSTQPATEEVKSNSTSPPPCDNDTQSNLNKDSLTLDLGKVPVVKEGVETPSAYVTSPIRKLREVPIMKNSYMSPMCATDELLLGLPPVHIIGCTFDPLLDDSIMFARRLRSLKRPVHFEIIDKLPHGFLNFSLVGKECKAASMVCVRHIMQVLYGFDEAQQEEFADLESEVK
ncbi:hormone-sensitive lipase-like [Asterias amurensis]|uniref:hormone-sensitive lipase-like n=1 Tax=Asterias amurensis TaxID=7602 RepID=UPI003AB5DCE4